MSGRRADRLLSETYNVFFAAFNINGINIKITHFNTFPESDDESRAVEEQHSLSIMLKS